MRMRNPKDKDELISNCSYFLDENLFINSNPIHIEIGMGKGDFILNMALAFPDINFVGIEKYSSVISVAIKKINNCKLDNLKLLNVDASNIPEYLNKKIDVIYLNFSDPWPKDRHAKRRLTHEMFLQNYDRLFIDKKTIIQKTDNDNLFLFSKESFVNYGYKIVAEYLDLHKENVFNIETEYENKFANKGIKIKYLKVEKEAD